ncbi:MAG: type II toxin-antitoxin system HicA family toxin [Thermodesulfobacteriota bacterium]
MTRLPILSSRELIRILIKKGFEDAPRRGKGCHTAFVKRSGDNKTRLVIAPDRKEIPIGTLAAMEKLREQSTF